MKVRLGFVSNSSSSSYIVLIKGIYLESFLEDLAEERHGSPLNTDKVLGELKDHRISIQQEDDDVLLVGFTVMHNDYQDTPPLLTEIILYYLFEKNHILRCRRDGD